MREERNSWPIFGLLLAAVEQDGGSEEGWSAGDFFEAPWRLSIELEVLLRLPQDFNCNLGNGEQSSGLKERVSVAKFVYV